MTKKDKYMLSFVGIWTMIHIIGLFWFNTYYGKGNIGLFVNIFAMFVMLIAIAVDYKTNFFRENKTSK